MNSFDASLDQRQHHFIVYHKNETASWTYEKILKAVRTIVFDGDILPDYLFPVLGKRSILQPQEFEYFPSLREWDWIQYNCHFLRRVIESKIASAVYFYLTRARTTTVRTLATRMHKYDHEIRRWIKMFRHYQIVIPTESLNRREAPFKLNMEFKLVHTIFLDMLPEKYGERELATLLRRGVGQGSKTRQSNRAHMRRKRSRTRS